MPELASQPDPARAERSLDTFGYEGWDLVIAAEGRSIAERVRQRTKAFVLDTGRDLIAIKGRLEHGQFTAWVETALGITPRTAQNYMAAAEAFGAKSEIVSHLPPTTIYKLAAAPEPVRASVLKRMEAGEPVRSEAILEEVQAARDEANKVRAKEKEASRRAGLTPEQREAEDLRKKRDAKSVALREKRLEEQREADRLQGGIEHDTGKEVAAEIVDAIGMERMAVLLTKVKDQQRLESYLWRITQARLATAQPITEIRMGDIFRMGRTYDFLADADRPRAQELAADIQQRGLLEPILVAVDGRHHYRILDGEWRFRALELLKWTAFPARIAPELDTVTEVMSPSTKPGAADTRQAATRNGQAAQRSGPTPELLRIMDQS